MTQAVERWAGQHGLPRGRKTFRILRDLSKVIGQEILPGILTDDTSGTDSSPSEKE